MVNNSKVWVEYIKKLEWAQFIYISCSFFLIMWASAMGEGADG
jgi:hypothetical protein